MYCCGYDIVKWRLWWCDGDDVVIDFGCELNIMLYVLLLCLLFMCVLTLLTCQQMVGMRLSVWMSDGVRKLPVKTNGTAWNAPSHFEELYSRDIWSWGAIVGIVTDWCQTGSGSHLLCVPAKVDVVNMYYWFVHFIVSDETHLEWPVERARQGWETCCEKAVGMLWWCCVKFCGGATLHHLHNCTTHTQIHHKDNCQSTSPKRLFRFQSKWLCARA